MNLSSLTSIRLFVHIPVPIGEKVARLVTIPNHLLLMEKVRSAYAGAKFASSRCHASAAAWRPVSDLTRYITSTTTSNSGTPEPPEKRTINVSTRHSQSKPSTTILGTQVLCIHRPPPNSLHQRGTFFVLFGEFVTFTHDGSFTTPPQHRFLLELFQARAFSVYTRPAQAAGARCAARSHVWPPRAPWAAAAVSPTTPKLQSTLDLDLDLDRTAHAGRTSPGTAIRLPHSPRNALALLALSSFLPRYRENARGAVHGCGRQIARVHRLRAHAGFRAPVQDRAGSNEPAVPRFVRWRGGRSPGTVRPPAVRACAHGVRSDLERIRSPWEVAC